MKNAIIAATLITGTLFQTNSIANSNHTFAVETDPATFALGGYALHLRASPNNYKYWRYGLGVYSLELPDVIVDINSKNRDEGWDVTLDRGIGLFAEYFFNGNRSDWYAGIQLAQQDFIIQNAATGNAQEKFTNVMLMPYLGYRWNIDKHYYIQAWGGAGYTEKVNGSNVLGPNTYDIDSIITFGALHIGYEF